MVSSKVEVAFSSFPLKGSKMRGGLHANGVTSGCIWRCAKEAEATVSVSPCALMNLSARVCSFHFLGDFYTNRRHAFKCVVLLTQAI